MSSVAEVRAAFPKLDTLDVDLIFCHVLNWDRAKVKAYPESRLSISEETQFSQLAGRRTTGEPLAYLLGYKEFWGLTLKVNNHVLIPRPETELLVEICFQQLSPGASILELGTGSGAVALALANDYQVVAVDKSAQAVKLAQHNAACLVKDVQFIVSDWFSEITTCFDCIVSNPPYVVATDDCLAELRFEPLTALAAGPAGLDCLAIIIAEVDRHLNDAGFLLLEHGSDQSEAVASLLQAAGFININHHQDLAGHVRVTGAVKS